MVFLKEHLCGNYQWAVESRNSFFNGSPTRRLFDRLNGFQVLYIINSFGEQSANFSVEEGKKIESLILNHLPLNPFSELSVINWLTLKNNLQ
jgi:hypothetical protein